MRKIILMMLLFASNCYGQKIYENAGNQSVTILNNSSYLLAYQDKQYTQIVAIESILFDSKESILSFMNDCLVVLESKQLRYTDKWTIIYLSDSWVSIENKIGSTNLKKSNILKIIEIIKK